MRSTQRRLAALAVGLVCVMGWADTSASAETGLTNPLIGCSSTDRTTGGGWLVPGGGFRRTFGLEAGVGPDAPPVGRVVFANHFTKERLVGRS